LDEFHRTGKVEGIREQIIRDIREGRKWGIQIMLVSQNIEDFDDIMINLSSTRFVLGANTPADADSIVKRFELSPSSRDIILNKILKPGRKGAGVYCSARTELGNAEMFLYLTLGLTELWAFDSTAENRTLRDIMYQRVGARKALEMLCKYFPSGSAAKEVERRRAEMTSERDEKARTIIEIIADEILAKETNVLSS
jgi:intracellular multiplication protein IcmB